MHIRIWYVCDNIRFCSYETIEKCNKHTTLALGMRAGRTYSCCVCCNIELQEEGGTTGLSLLPQQGINIHSWWNTSIVKWGVGVPIWTCTGHHTTHRGKQRWRGTHTHTSTSTLKGRDVHCIEPDISHIPFSTWMMHNNSKENTISTQPYQGRRHRDAQTYHTFHQSENQEALRLGTRGALHQSTQSARCIHTFTHGQQGKNTKEERVKEKHQPNKACFVSIYLVLFQAMKWTGIVETTVVTTGDDSVYGMSHWEAVAQGDSMVIPPLTLQEPARCTVCTYLLLQGLDEEGHIA